MTRSYKFQERDHHSEQLLQNQNNRVPRHYNKLSHADADPLKAKKNGGGRGNWGREGDEIEDSEYNMSKVHRRSNSFSNAVNMANFRTKFETVEPDPVFEEYDEFLFTLDKQKLERRDSTVSESIEEDAASEIKH